MKFRMQIKNQGDSDESAWWEELDLSDVPDAKICAEEMVAEFNNSLRPGETPREVVCVEVLDPDTDPEHEWIHLATIRDPVEGLLRRLYQCLKCGVTGSRPEMAHVIIRDPQFESQVYADCKGAREHFMKERNRGE